MAKSFVIAETRKVIVLQQVSTAYISAHAIPEFQDPGRRNFVPRLNTRWQLSPRVDRLWWRHKLLAESLAFVMSKWWYLTRDVYAAAFLLSQVSRRQRPSDRTPTKPPRVALHTPPLCNLHTRRNLCGGVGRGRRRQGLDGKCRYH